MVIFLSSPTCCCQKLIPLKKIPYVNEKPRNKKNLLFKLTRLIKPYQFALKGKRIKFFSFLQIELAYPQKITSLLIGILLAVPSITLASEDGEKLEKDCLNFSENVATEKSSVENMLQNPSLSLDTQDPSSNVTIKKLQHAIHEHVKRLGGYWRPLSALARVTEEYGEFCQVIEDSPHDTFKIGLELADLFLISTCLANQYCCNLSLEYKKIGVPCNLDGIHNENWKPIYSHTPFTMAFLIGELARVVNSYEGDKKPKIGANLLTIQESITRLHSAIWGYAIANKINLVRNISETIEISASRDKGRFETVYDPTMCQSLESFEIIQKKIECPYAREAKIWGSPKWNNQESVLKNIECIISVLDRFIKISKLEGLDGFVIAAPEKYGLSISKLSKFMKDVLGILSERDPRNERCMDRKIDDESWQFSYSSQRFFITAFASCYAENNSRYAWNTKSTFILLQPESSFALHSIPREEELVSKRNKIRQAFRNHNRDYDRSDIMDSKLEAIRYIKPLRKEDPIVKWWESDAETEEDGYQEEYCVLL